MLRHRFAVGTVPKERSRLDLAGSDPSGVRPLPLPDVAAQLGERLVERRKRGVELGVRERQAQVDHPARRRVDPALEEPEEEEEETNEDDEDEDGEPRARRREEEEEEDNTLSLAQMEAQLKPEARYLVFHCADDFGGTAYYESIDLVDAFHPQTILAYGMNDGELPVGHGAPLRLRVERQLGYKHAKFVMRVEAVSSLAGIGAGKGGFWEDTINYDWYAGI